MLAEDCGSLCGCGEERCEIAAARAELVDDRARLLRDLRREIGVDPETFAAKRLPLTARRLLRDARRPR